MGSHRGGGKVEDDGSAPDPPASAPLPLQSPPAAPTRALMEQVARERRDPRMKGIVLSRLFEDEIEPQRIGRFTLLDRLGEGGMGVVYAAYDDRLDRKVAVKVLRPWAAEGPSEDHDRLLHEARTMARLSHPNIVTVHEVGVHEGDVFVAMEYIRGQSLDRWLEGPPAGRARPWREVVEVFVAAGRGLAAAHRAGIVHRDFKPYNVILDEDGVPKVLDFGLARMVEPAGDARGAESTEPRPDARRDTTRPPRTEGLVGTPAYMAPEQWKGAPADERSDQFGFFASLHHALYRQLPFAASSLEALALSAEEGRVRPPPPDSGVPRWLHRRLLVGLHPDPAQRFPSMSAALSALGRDPVARRRRWLWLAGFTAAVAGAGALAAIELGPSAPTRCMQGQQAMDDAWGSPERAEVERGLLASGLPFAGETWERAAPRLDAYAERWADARDEACRAHRDGAHSSMLYDRQVVCLERRRVAFEVLVELLTSADRSAAERALPASATLPSVEPCADPQALLASVPPPDTPAVAREVETERHRLARVGEHEALGQYAPALALAHRVEERAEALGYRPLRAEAMVRLGSLTMEHGSPADADTLLTEALTHALASAHDEAAAEAVARRIFVRAERMRTPERAADDVEIGEGLLERVEAEPRLRGLYHNNVGAYYIHRGDYGAARRALLRALEVKRAGLGPDDPDIAQTLGNLAIVEQYAGEDEQARAYLDEALALAEHVLGPHHSTTAQLARLRGEQLFNAGRPRAARRALEAVLDTLHETTGPRSPLHHGPLITLGEIALDQRRYVDALAAFDRAAQLEIQRDGGGAMYRMLEEAGRARALMGRGEVEAGLATLRRLVARAEQDGAPYGLMLRGLLVSVLLEQDRVETALLEAERADTLDPSTPPTPARIALVRSRAEALRRLGQPARAELELERARAMLDALGGAHRLRSAMIQLEQSRVALDTARRDPAIAHARAALDALDGWGEDDLLPRVRIRIALAEALSSGEPSPKEREEAAALRRQAASAYAAYGAGFAEELAALVEPA